MQFIRVLSLLLDYPTPALAEAKNELLALATTSALPEVRKEQLKLFIENRCDSDIMDWQSHYDSLFERGRSLSLLLFEHVHGESRDRGQAMVDLMGEYREAGLDIGVRELPDYIPLYLEYLSTQGEENLKIGLADVAHIMSVLACRLEQRDSDYAVIFYSLIDLAGVEVDLDEVREQLKTEKRDDTKEALDKVWEEEMVTFGPDSAGDGCSSAVNKPAPGQSRENEVPINWADAKNAAAATVERGA